MVRPAGGCGARAAPREPTPRPIEYQSRVPSVYSSAASTSSPFSVCADTAKAYSSRPGFQAVGRIRIDLAASYQSSHRREASRVCSGSSSGTTGCGGSFASARRSRRAAAPGQPAAGRYRCRGGWRSACHSAPNWSASPGPTSAREPRPPSGYAVANRSFSRPLLSSHCKWTPASAASRAMPSRTGSASTATSRPAIRRR